MSEVLDIVADLRRLGVPESVLTPIVEWAQRDVEPGCGCYACVGSMPAYPGAWLTVGMSMMIVCGLCGNKRCPHGTDHRHPCTRSNDAEQPGSRYGGMTPDAAS